MRAKALATRNNSAEQWHGVKQIENPYRREQVQRMNTGHPDDDRPL